VGTVIDAEMSGDIRVTIVATGLGVEKKSVEEPVRLVENTVEKVDYRDFDRPTVMRQKNAGEQGHAVDNNDPDYLDIPAFLRRQAD